VHIFGQAKNKSAAYLKR